MATSLAVRPRPATGRRTVIGGIPLVRVRPVPPFEPPYDDERRPPEQPEPRPSEALEAPERDARPERDDRYRDERQWGPAPAGGAPPRAGSGGQAARLYIGLCVEVLEGFRPAAHLRRLTLASAFDTVLAQLARPAVRIGHPSSAGPMPSEPTPATEAPPAAVTRPAGRIGGGPGGTRIERLRLRRLWVGEPSDGVVEAAAVLGRSGRAWAVALRLQRHDGGWLCTDLQVV